MALNSALPSWKMLSFHVPTRHVRDLSFSICPSNKHCPSARCTYAANVVGKYPDIFPVGAVSLHHILYTDFIIIIITSN
jgi:hypothetical protein